MIKSALLGFVAVCGGVETAVVGCDEGDIMRNYVKPWSIASLSYAGK